MAVKPAISEVISNSPLALLERHAGVCVDCVERLPLYFEEAQAGRWGRAGEVREDICRLEGLADELKQDVRSNLPRGLWMSVSRADLLELVRVQDKMANGAKEVSGISSGRQLAFPASLTSDVIAFLDVVIDVSRTVVKIIGATRELSRSAALRGRLRECEAELSPVDAIFLYQLLAGIGDIANNAEKVAHRAQIIATS